MSNAPVERVPSRTPTPPTTRVDATKTYHQDQPLGSSATPTSGKRPTTTKRVRQDPRRVTRTLIAQLKQHPRSQRQPRRQRAHHQRCRGAARIARAGGREGTREDVKAKRRPAESSLTVAPVERVPSRTPSPPTTRVATTDTVHAGATPPELRHPQPHEWPPQTQCTKAQPPRAPTQSRDAARRCRR